MNTNLFLIKVFLTLISQLIITFLVFYYLSTRVGIHIHNYYYLFFIFIVSIFLIFLISACKLSIPIKFGLFTLFSILFGVMLFPSYKHKHTIMISLFGAIGVFMAMLVTGIILTRMKINLSFLGNILLASLIGLIIASCIDLMFENVNRTFVYIGLIIYSLFVVFDTQVILKKGYGNDYVSASLSYYLDFLGIFIRLNQLK